MRKEEFEKRLLEEINELLDKNLQNLAKGDLFMAKRTLYEIQNKLNKMKTRAKEKMTQKVIDPIINGIAWGEFWEWDQSYRSIVVAPKFAEALSLAGMKSTQLRKILELAREIRDAETPRRKEKISKMYFFIAYQAGRKRDFAFNVILSYICPLLMEMIKEDNSEKLNEKLERFYAFLESTVAYFTLFSREKDRR